MRHSAFKIPVLNEIFEIRPIGPDALSQHAPFNISNFCSNRNFLNPTPLPTMQSTRPSARGSSLGPLYSSAIAAAIDQHEAEAGGKLGALLMEPVLQGAGGMLCVDPAFQRALVQVGGAMGAGGWGHMRFRPFWCMVVESNKDRGCHT